MRQYDFHRFFLLWMRHPHHKYRFKVWQWLQLRSHVMSCSLCQKVRDKKINDTPRIGGEQSPN